MKPSWRLALEGLAPGAVIAALQAVILTAVLDRLLDLTTGQMAALLPFAVLTGLAFAAVNQALVGWFGGVGRFVSVIMVVLAAAGAITSAVPEVFDSITPLLPLTPALQGFRAITSDGSGAAGAAGLLAGLVADRSQRRRPRRRAAPDAARWVHRLRPYATPG